MISFDVTADEATIIEALAQRASKAAQQAGFRYTTIDASMDITACHANGTRLDLCKFLDFDDFNFAHDAFGIRRHINRKTGVVEDCFLPRCAAHEADPC